MRPSLTSLAVVSAAIVFATMHGAHAQAWVGDRGNLDISLDYNLGTSSKVVETNGMSFPNAGSTTHQFTLGVEYVPIRLLAVDVSLPFVALKYTGDKTLYPHPGGGTYDDGSYHTTLTDLAARVRYQVLEDPIAFSPHIGVSIPVASYETIGNTVAGRHLKQLHLGGSVGKIFADTFYAHLQYEFSLVEKYDKTADTKTFGQNHSDVTVTLGDKLLDYKLDINIGANYRLTHGGVNFTDLASDPGDVSMYHDAVLAESMFLLGGGIGYQFAESFSASVAYRYFVTGTNTQNASVFGLSLTFSPLH